MYILPPSQFHSNAPDRNCRTPRLHPGSAGRHGADRCPAPRQPAWHRMPQQQVPCHPLFLFHRDSDLPEAAQRAAFSSSPSRPVRHRDAPECPGSSLHLQQDLLSCSSCHSYEPETPLMQPAAPLLPALPPVLRQTAFHPSPRPLCCRCAQARKYRPSSPVCASPPMRPDDLHILNDPYDNLPCCVIPCIIRRLVPPVEMFLLL